ncbi:MAG: SGNH/GDSL hydrolase family protein [Cyanobacteria bacterium J06621_3]
MARNHRLIKAVTGAAISAVMLAGIAPLKALAQDYSSINIFGDSLVDSGNLFTLTGLPPSPPYAQKISNGSIWVESLADALGLSPALSAEVLPGISAGVLPPADGINFALAGSLSSNINVGGDPLTGLQQQIAAYQAIAPLAPPTADSLFVLLAGGNDYNQALLDPNLLPTELQALPDQVTNNLTAAATGLINSGAKNLLIVNLPDLGEQPLAQQLNLLAPESDKILTQLSTDHNSLLEQKLAALEAATGANIIGLDLNGLVQKITSDPASFGFTNVSEACLTNAQPGFVFEGVCSNPNEFVFWDQTHPTEAVHDEVAQLALDALMPSVNPGQTPQGIPEPSGILSLGLLGGIAAITRKKFVSAREAS